METSNKSRGTKMNGNPQSTFSAFHGKAICKLQSKFEMNFSCALERYSIKTISANVDQGTFVRFKSPWFHALL